MRAALPRSLASLAAAFALVIAGSAAHAQEANADAFCALYSPEEVSDVLGAKLTPELGGDDSCTWFDTNYIFTSVTASWYGGTIADHKATWPDGTDLTIGGRTAYFSPGDFLPELLVELDAGVLSLMVSGFEGDVHAALTELGELAVSRADSLPPPPSPEPEPESVVSHADRALEALFPETVGGEALGVLSVGGEQAISDGTKRPAVAEVLGTLGKTFDDLSQAAAFLPDGTGAVIAFRVAGADAPTFMEPFLDAQGSMPWAEMTSAQVAGKDVHVFAGQPPAYIYPAGDVIWVVYAEEPALSEILTALP